MGIYDSSRIARTLLGTGTRGQQDELRGLLYDRFPAVDEDVTEFIEFVGFLFGPKAVEHYHTLARTESRSGHFILRKWGREPIRLALKLWSAANYSDETRAYLPVYIRFSQMPDVSKKDILRVGTLFIRRAIRDRVSPEYCAAAADAGFTDFAEVVRTGAKGVPLEYFLASQVAA